MMSMAEFLSVIAGRTEIRSLKIINHVSVVIEISYRFENRVRNVRQTSDIMYLLNFV